jgi:hypothetical protein
VGADSASAKRSWSGQVIEYLGWRPYGRDEPVDDAVPIGLRPMVAPLVEDAITANQRREESFGSLQWPGGRMFLNADESYFARGELLCASLQSRYSFGTFENENKWLSVR